MVIGGGKGEASSLAPDKTEQFVGIAKNFDDNAADHEDQAQQEYPMQPEAHREQE
ncbi:hypothetical protein [Paenibacillus sp. UNC496MF]|uniref:hypothetical protein n=1 Tax=Paenibacillus sp. UNC496MF TaxID=1502753 RepID=UPI001C42F9BD|nr:hypothetical protein [Paenibacillus sp. UNC496MF]